MVAGGILSDRQLMIVGGAVGVGFLAWWLMRGTAGIAEDASRAAVGVATGAATGAVIGVGDAVGLPDTRTKASQDKCKQAMADGNDWAASFYCPASTWVGGLFDGR